MNFQKIIYLSFVSLLLSGCFQSDEKMEALLEVKKEIEVKKPVVKQISVAQKKKRFKDRLVPIVTDVYNELQSQYVSIKNDIQNNTNKLLIEKLKKEYKAKTDKSLLEALKPHPISIVLAQAAAESAWLTSRFTKEANNIFGVWSFNKKEPRIAASGLRGDKTIYLKKYSTMKEAVRDYYKNLAKNWAYKEFREERLLTSNPYVLSDYLINYSEKKDIYTKLLRSMIKYNKFDSFDIKSDIEYTQYIEKKPKKELEVKAILAEVNDVNQTETKAIVGKIVDLKNDTNKAQEKITMNVLEIKDNNITKIDN